MMTECCGPKERDESVYMITDLVERVMYKINDLEGDKAKEVLLKFFKFLGKQEDLVTLAEVLIQKRADVEKVAVKNKMKDAQEDEMEDDAEETEISNLFG